MRQETAARLLELNRGFYQRFALAFAAKRSRLQPGAARVLQRIHPQESVLDLGCGHGLFASALVSAGHHGMIAGLDSSAELLDVARRRKTLGAVGLAQADLADPNWPLALGAGQASRFDWIVAFAVLHHLPSDDMRRRVVQQCGPLTAPEGRLVVSVWDFLASPRWSARVVPWETVSIDGAYVDPDDYLLDWREGGLGYRYVHHFSPETLAALATASGFTVEETYRSDGEGGRLGLYQVWRK